MAPDDWTNPSGSTATDKPASTSTTAHGSIFPETLLPTASRPHRGHGGLGCAEQVSPHVSLTTQERV